MSAPKRVVGPVTGAATGGAAFGVAMAQIIVHFWPSLASTEESLAVVLALAVGFLSGYFVPPQRPAVVTPSPDGLDADRERHAPASEPHAAPVADDGAGAATALPGATAARTDPRAPADYQGRANTHPGEALALPPDG